MLLLSFEHITTIFFSWLDWAKGNKNLKIVSFPVPVGILPKECPSGELLDVKVSCRGPDDAIYDKYQQIRQRVSINTKQQW